MIINKLSTKHKIGYGLGALTENNMQNSVNMMLMLIMFNFMGMNPILIGYIFGITRLWDAVSDPLVGYLSDKTRSKYGKRKPYMIFGLFLTSLAFIGMWLFPVGESDMWYFYYLTIFCLLYYTGTTFFCVPYISMGYELASDYNDRTNLMGYRSFFVNIGALILPWMFWFTQLSYFDSPLIGMRFLSIICSLFFIVFGLGPIFLTPTVSSRVEDLTTEASEAVKVSVTEKIGIKDIFTAFTVKPFLLLVLTLAFSVFGLFLITYFGGNVVIYYVCQGDTVFSSKILGIAGVVSALSCIVVIPLINWTAKKIGKRNALIAFLGLAVLGNLLTLVFYTPQYPYLAIVQPILGAVGISALWMLLFAMISDVCDWDDLYNHRRREGIFAAIISWTCKLGYSICSIFAGYILVWSGFVLELSAKQVGNTFLNMRIMLSVIPAIGLTLAMMILLLYPLNRKRVEEIKSQLELRNAE